MSEIRDEKLESMLRARRAQAPRSNLAERIILKAAVMPQLRSDSLWRLVQDLFAEFHLPKPAFVLAGALALGTVVGLSTPSYNPNAQDGAVSNTQRVFAADEGLL